MIACSLMRLATEEYGSLREYWSTIRVSRIWMLEYVVGRMKEEMHGRTALVRAHDCVQGNAIGDGGTRELARVLELNKCITHLDVAVCRRKERMNALWGDSTFAY